MTMTLSTPTFAEMQTALRRANAARAAYHALLYPLQRDAALANGPPNSDPSAAERLKDTPEAREYDAASKAYEALVRAVARAS
jgi:hypothetical protein